MDGCITPRKRFRPGSAISGFSPRGSYIGFKEKNTSPGNLYSRRSGGGGVIFVGKQYARTERWWFYILVDFGLGEPLKKAGDLGHFNI